MKREQYFFALVQLGLPPSEQALLTVDQFDGLCHLVDQRNAKEAQA